MRKALKGFIVASILLTASGYTMFNNNEVQESAEEPTQYNNQMNTQPNNEGLNADTATEEDKERKQLKVGGEDTFGIQCH